MFMCDNCHNPDKHLAPRSRGICEGCGRLADCVDCKDSHCTPKRKKAKA